jgi:hypothetical protein
MTARRIKKPFPAITNKTAIPRLIKPHEGSGVTPSSLIPHPPTKTVAGFRQKTAGKRVWFPSFEKRVCLLGGMVRKKYYQGWVALFPPVFCGIA